MHLRHAICKDPVTRDDILRYPDFKKEERTDLTWQEDVRAKEDLDKLMRVKHGSKPKHRPIKSSDSEELWTTKKIAELLNQSKSLAITLYFPSGKGIISKCSNFEHIDFYSVLRY